MITIQKEDWLFAFNEEDPEYDEKFNELFQKYYANMLEKDICTEEEKNFVHKYTMRPYWVLNLPGFKGQSFKEAEKTRIDYFLVIIDKVGMFDACHELFGPEHAPDLLKTMYFTTLIIQNDRYRVEVLGKKPLLPKIMKRKKKNNKVKIKENKYDL